MKNNAPIGPLHGVPVTIKLNVDVKGEVTTNGVAANRNLIASEDSAVVANLRKAGAIIQSKPGRTTDVLVRGRPNQLQIAGEDGGTKLMEIRRLAALGHRITIIGERQFWKLAASKPRARRRKTRP